MLELPVLPMKLVFLIFLFLTSFFVVISQNKNSFSTIKIYIMYILMEKEFLFCEIITRVRIWTLDVFSWIFFYHFIIWYDHIFEYDAKHNNMLAINNKTRTIMEYCIML